MRKGLRRLWLALGALVGAALMAGLLGLKFESWALAGVGAAIGLPLGWLFARLISPAQILEETLS